MLVASLLTLLASGTTSAQSITVTAAVNGNTINVSGSATWAKGVTGSVSVNVAPVAGGVITPTSGSSIPTNPMNNPPRGMTGVTFGTPNPVSLGSYNNGDYYVWGILSLSTGGSPTYVYSQWSKVTINAGGGNNPPAANVTATAGLTTVAGQVVTGTVTGTNLTGGSRYNAAFQLIAIPQSGSDPLVIGPGGVTIGTSQPNDSGVATITLNALPSGTYTLVGIISVTNGGVTQLVLSPPVTGITIK
jgi:hypothetical protein